MFNYIIKRILQLIPVALGVASLTFLIIHLSPGDPVEVILGEYALPADRESLRESLGLNLPIFQQYINFLTGLMHFDLGESIFTGKDVFSEIASRLPATAELAFASLFFAIIFAFTFGTIAALNRGKWQDKTAISFSLLGFSMPNFWLGPMLMIVFALYLQWLPVSGRGTFEHLILPAFTLGFSMASVSSRLIRSALLDEFSKDYIKTAKSKGLSKCQILFFHAYPNALIPVITVLFLQAGALLTGAIITEAIFSWPGVGSLLVDGLNKRDYAVVQGCVLFISFVYLFMTLLSDIFYAIADPRVRYSKT